MKNLRNMLCVFAVLAFAACGQTDNSAVNTSDTTSMSKTGSSAEDEKAVAAAVDSLHKGTLDPEKNLLENIASDALSYGHSGGAVENKPEFVEGLLNGPFDFTSVETADQTIRVDGDNAIVRHIFIAKASNAGAPVDLRMGMLLVWRKEGGEWKLLARQAYKLPEAAKK